MRMIHWEPIVRNNYERGEESISNGTHSERIWKLNLILVFNHIKPNLNTRLKVTLFVGVRPDLAPVGLRKQKMKKF